MTGPETTGSKIRWGIFGSGGIARRFAQDMRFSRTGTLAAVASRTPENAQGFAQLFPGTKVFDDFNDLARSDEVDAIYVATPNALHKDHSLIAISAGKAVLCEKPFACDAAEAREVAAAAAAANVFCMEAMWTRFLPIMADLRQRIASGELGQMVHLEASLGFARTERPGDPITDPALGGGALHDLGCYGMSIAEFLLGPFQLEGGTVERSATGSSRTAAFVLRHATDGAAALSTISVSHATQMRNTLVLSGSQARVTLDAPFIQAGYGTLSPVRFAGDGAAPDSLRARLSDSLYGQKAKRMIRAVMPGHAKISAPFHGSGLQFEIDEVGTCLGGGRTISEIMPPETTISVLNALEKLDGSQASIS
ncbi:Gfo/Idh/MocA family protein [Ruegeria hyattellae]|uniref:Gfo/Idh/MocA family protein n=1 Tax=Ruegeria hyattellae TaxID=3233337 RepID=UPI00355AE509